VTVEKFAVEKFFGLARNPFAATPDSTCYFETPSHREAVLGLLDAVAERKGLATLTGEAGSGKTTVLRLVAEGFQGALQLARILNPVLLPEEFLEHVFLSLGVDRDAPPSKARLMLALEQHCAKRHGEGQYTALLIDEAHKLPEAVLAEIHFLSNFETAGARTLQIVLAGQPQLHPLLQQPGLEALKQRVALSFGLEHLTPEQTADYVRFRWDQAGGGPDSPFRAEAVTGLWQCSRGLPRLINTVCENALRNAAAAGRRVLEANDFRQAAQHLESLALPADYTTVTAAATSVAQQGDLSSAAPASPRAAPSSSAKRRAYRRVKVRLSPTAPLFPFDGGDENAAAQYRIVRTRIGQQHNPPAMLLVSSPGNGDGRTLTALNVAAALALKSDAKVLLVDADFRRSRCAEWLGVPESPGLTDVLSGGRPLEDAIIQLAELPSLCVLPAGGPRQNPTELLDSSEAAVLFARLRGEFAYTLIDGPPIGSVADYEILLMHCDGVVVVVRPDHTKRSLYKQAVGSVPPEKLAGILLNHAAPSSLRAQRG
jgi:capsular exopolysaccharide synthesis family protein